jgi:hypothetical protein
MTLMLPYHYMKAALVGGIASGDVPVDWLTDTVKVTLHTATYAPNRLTHRWYSDLTNELATATGYTAGGETFTGKTVSTPDGDGSIFVDAADVSWNFTASKTFRYAVVRKDTGTGGTSPLLWLVDFEADQTISLPFTLIWNASGLWEMN